MITILREDEEGNIVRTELELSEYERIVSGEALREKYAPEMTLDEFKKDREEIKRSYFHG